MGRNPCFALLRALDFFPKIVNYITMEDSTRFPADQTLDKLASELSLEERHSLLEKLTAQSSVQADLLYTAEEEEEGEDYEEIYVRLPWYYRLYYNIISFFKSRPPVRIFEDSRIARLGREIEAKASGLYDYQRNFLCVDFCRLLTELKEGARFFFSALDVSVNRDRGSFYAFLGSLEMEDVHRLLSEETDPGLITERSPSISEAELKQQVFRIMEEAFSSITDEQRNTMYRNARSLYCLKELSSFLFDRVIIAFSAARGGQSCPANVVKDMLKNLGDILYSLKEPPPMPLLESLFIFQLSDKSGGNDFNMGEEMRGLLIKAEDAIIAIRNFNRRVPLTQILRCAYRNMNLCPQAISGGEDWYISFREHWKRLVETKLSDFIRQRRNQELINSFKYFLKGTNLKILENVVSDSTPEGFSIPEALSLSFLLTFYSAVFMIDINKVLRPILLDGEFVKRETRTKFTESYNDLMKLEDDIRHFETDISPSGELGKRYFLAKQDISSLPVKRRKVQLVLEDASRQAGGIVQRTRQAINIMIDIIVSVMNNDSDGKYDILGNFNKIAAKVPSFTASLTEVIQKLQKAVQLLDDINMIGGRR
jgi:hypothetical protein